MIWRSELSAIIASRRPLHSLTHTPIQWRPTLGDGPSISSSPTPKWSFPPGGGPTQPTSQASDSPFRRLPPVSSITQAATEAEPTMRSG